MITLIRHSERLDRTDPIKWRKSKRFKENMYDTPITANGKIITKNAINKLFNSNYKSIDYIYCSPLTRCIQTALIIRKELKKQFNKDIKIRIEYGLVENNFNEPIIFDKNKDKFIYDSNSKRKYLDSKLKINNLIKKYKNHIDLNYNSIIKFNMVGFDRNEVDFINRSIEIFKNIKKLHHKDDNVLICTHGGIIFGVYSYLKKTYDFTNDEKVAGNYCSMLVTNLNQKKIELINNFDIFQR